MFCYHKQPPKMWPRFDSALRRIAVNGVADDEWGGVTELLARKMLEVFETLEDDPEFQRDVGGEGYVQRR